MSMKKCRCRYEEEYKPFIDDDAMMETNALERIKGAGKFEDVDESINIRILVKNITPASDFDIFEPDVIQSWDDLDEAIKTLFCLLDGSGNFVESQGTRAVEIHRIYIGNNLKRYEFDVDEVMKIFKEYHRKKMVKKERARKMVQFEKLKEELGVN
jgi:phosphomevalonate kinase